MAYEQKDNTFSLFDNDKKGNDKAPDYKGKGLINGEEVKIAVWKRTGKTGVEYLSGVIEANEKPVAEPAPQPAQEALSEEISDEIPFNKDR